MQNGGIQNDCLELHIVITKLLLYLEMWYFLFYGSMDSMESVKLPSDNYFRQLNDCDIQEVRIHDVILHVLNIRAYLAYCVVVWYSPAKLCITSVGKVQKLVCRVITSIPTRTSFALLFSILNFLNVNVTFNQCTLVIIYKWNT